MAWAIETGRQAVATPSIEELLDSEESAETHTGLPSPPSRYLVLSRRTGESEVDGRATQSIMLVRKDDMFRSEGGGGDGVDGAAGGTVDKVDVVLSPFCDGILLLSCACSCDMSTQ